MDVNSGAVECGEIGEECGVDFADEVALEFPESSCRGESLGGAVFGGVVGGVGVPAGPDDAEPGAGDDADGVGVALPRARASA
jgi:hypothetical protein